MDLYLKKISSRILVPADKSTEEALYKIKAGTTIHGQFKRARNYNFHKKFFALLRFLFEHWQPGELQDPRWKGVKPQKSFERFRKDITILAGFYEATYRIDGSVRIEAKDISFGKMSEEEFEELYQRVIDVGLQKILPGDYDDVKVREVVDQLLSFG